MNKLFALTAAALLATSAAASAGDAAAGEKDFRKCKACHTIASADETIIKGGKTGPNLYGVIGRTAGTVEDFRYGDSIVAAGEAGLVWTEENLTEYVADPKKFLSDYLGESAKSKMTFKLKKGENIATYLASVAE
ncbi:c-type cytochrome [Celeribacter sp.]|uniref:c-type cytochrome n=1 Tax=Celeribacter sp. TaxID=1890673 RepID=UPI003A9038F9